MRTLTTKALNEDEDDTDDDLDDEENFEDAQDTTPQDESSCTNDEPQRRYPSRNRHKPKPYDLARQTCSIHTCGKLR